MVLETNPFIDIEELKEEIPEEYLQKKLDEYLITDFKPEEE
jgi:hypothetical protein